jgi:hypothetical protein
MPAARRCSVHHVVLQESESVQQLQTGRRKQRLVAVRGAGQPTQIHERRTQAFTTGHEVHQDVAGHFHAGLIQLSSASPGDELGDMGQNLAA